MWASEYQVSSCIYHSGKKKKKESSMPTCIAKTEANLGR